MTVKLIRDVVISNLRLENDTTLLNDSAELQTLDGGITAYTGATQIFFGTHPFKAGQLAAIQLCNFPKTNH